MTVTAGSLALVKLTRALGLRSVTADRALQRALVQITAEEYAGPLAAPRGWAQAAERGAQSVGLSAVDEAEVAALWVAEPELRGCSSAECQERLGQMVGARVVVRAGVMGKYSPARRGGAVLGDCRLSAKVFDVAVGEVGASGNVDCTSCTQAQAEEALAGLVRQQVQAAAARPRGIIELRSVPPRADVFINGRRLGFTPYARPAFVGKQDVAVARLGYQTFHAVAQVTDGQPWSKEVKLVEGVDSDVRKVVLREETLPRPLWRKAAGGALIGAGVIALAAGAVSVWLNGKCTNDRNAELASVDCDRVYDTAGMGYALVGVGAAALVGGLVITALPGQQRQVEVKVGSLSSGYGVQLMGRY